MLSGSGARASAAETPLPRVEDILKRAMERGEAEPVNDARFKEQYFFVRSKTTEIRNSEGELKQRQSKVSTNAPIAPALIAAPAPEAVGATKAGSSKQAAGASGGAYQAAARKFDKNQFQFNDDLVSRYDFKLIGREITNGCSALVLDFAPKKKKLPENGIRDRLINRVAGRVWVDEREFAVQKCALHLIESVNIVGGIVGEAQKFEYRFDRERTSEGLWYVRDSEWHLEGREVLVHRKADYHETRTGVHKQESAEHPQH